MPKSASERASFTRDARDKAARSHGAMLICAECYKGQQLALGAQAEIRRRSAYLAAPRRVLHQESWPRSEPKRCLAVSPTSPSRRVCDRALRRAHCSKRDLPSGAAPGRTDPPPSAQANHAPSRYEPRLRHCPPRGALIPRAFRASAICPGDIAPVR
jgi:hypothetical protein